MRIGTQEKAKREETIREFYRNLYDGTQRRDRQIQD